MLIRPMRLWGDWFACKIVSQDEDSSGGDDQMMSSSNDGEDEGEIKHEAENEVKYDINLLRGYDSH